jgi:hypothetical protein
MKQECRQLCVPPLVWMTAGHPVDFVKVAEACSLRGVRIENPSACKEQSKNVVAMDVPVLIECVVDTPEPPWPPVMTRDEQNKLITALARGERNRTPIGLTMGRHANTATGRCRTQMISFNRSCVVFDSAPAGTAPAVTRVAIIHYKCNSNPEV